MSVQHIRSIRSGTGHLGIWGAIVGNGFIMRVANTPYTRSVKHFSVYRVRLFGISAHLSAQASVHATSRISISI